MKPKRSMSWYISDKREAAERRGAHPAEVHGLLVLENLYRAQEQREKETPK